MQDRSQRLNSAAVQGDSLQQAQRMQRSLGSSATDPSPLVGQNSSMARKCVDSNLRDSLRLAELDQL